MSRDLVRFVGPLAALRNNPPLLACFLERSMIADGSVRATTAAILERVRRDGDRALLALATDFDGVELESLEVSHRARRTALERLASPVRDALERSAANIALVHRAFIPTATEIETEPGVRVGRRPDPLARVGVYAPGGRAAYPSSVLMGAIPARIAGVETIVVCSPPTPSGSPPSIVLAAAEIARVDRLFSVGGAGAIAAMAFGTETVPRVSRIVGPGNAYVAEAKLQVQGSGMVTIDSPAGPSELLVIADDTADPTAVARELLAQAEHDPMASVIAITDSEPVTKAIADAIRVGLPGQERSEIISQALRARGALLWTDKLLTAAAFAEEYAPEHLMLAGTRAEDLVGQIRSAGTIFVGQSSSVTFGDYMTGANHVLPTGGAARSYSGLSTSDFIRWTTWQRVDRTAASAMAHDVAVLAECEHLAGHAAAARAWDTLPTSSPS